MPNDDQGKYYFEFGPFRLGVTERLLLREGTPLLLPPKVFDTLLILLANCGSLLRKDELMRAVWPDTVVEENNLSQYISALRKMLGDDLDEHKYIETVPRLGYRFVASVKELGDKNAVSNLKIASIFAVIRGEIDGKNTQVFGREQSYSLPLRSIGVLPFKYLGADADEYLGLGIADAIITRLSNLKQIVVRPTGSVRKFAGLIHDPVMTGRKLRVDSVLDGSIQRAGDRIRATVQLISVQAEAPVWAEQFDVEFRDLFTVEDSISEQVAASLILKLTREERQRLTKHHTENISAYQLYLKGRYYWNKRDEEGIKKGIWCFQQAIDADPGYALALAGLADCYNLAGYYSGERPQERFPQAKAAATRALEIDDQLAEAHASLAFSRAWYDWDFIGAENEFRRALDLNENYATAHHWYALYLLVMGRYAEASTEVKRAQELDPLSMAINRDVGWIFHIGGRQYDQAIAQYLNTLELDSGFWPARWLLGTAYQQKGLYEEAISELNQALALSGGKARMKAGIASEEQIRILAELGHTYALFGQTGAAELVLGEMRELAERQYVSPYEFALLHLGMGDKEQAFDSLHLAYEDRSDRLIYLKVDPTLDRLHSDPRFGELLRRVGFASSPS